MHRIVVANAKGGCGKTTLSTNICAYYSSRGLNVRLFDYDDQESSLEWLKIRQEQAVLGKKGHIEGVSAFKSYDHHHTRSWMLRIPEDTDRVVIDTPAGTTVNDLCAILNQNDHLIIPVMASPIDIKAAAKFIHLLTQQKAFKDKNINIAVVANRIKKKTRSYYHLERFLFALKIPFITSFRDTQLYSRAYELGIGISDLKIARVEKDKNQWLPVFRWCEVHEHIKTTIPIPIKSQTVS